MPSGTVADLAPGQSVQLFLADLISAFYRANRQLAINSPGYTEQFDDVYVLADCIALPGLPRF